MCARGSPAVNRAARRCEVEQGLAAELAEVPMPPSLLALNQPSTPYPRNRPLFPPTQVDLWILSTHPHHRS